MHHSVSNILIRRKGRWRNSDIFILDFHDTVGGGGGVLLTCYKARVTSVEYNKVPEKAYAFTFTELESF